MQNLWRNAGAYIALGIVFLIFALLEPQFRQPSNLLNVLDQSVEIAVVAVGMTAIILTGGIDLSVGSVAALAPFLAAFVMTTWPHALSGFGGTTACGLTVALGVGALIGAVNGLTITKTFLPPFIATLGMMSIARGLAYVFSNGTGISNLPEGFQFTGKNLISLPVGHNLYANLTWAVVVMVVVFAAGHLILSRSSVGRAIYAIGGNETAAHLSGVRVDRVKIGVYIFAGLLAAFGGIIETATVGTATPQAAENLELNAIAAVVIGGTSLTGGRGSLVGTFAGALLMRMVSNGLTLHQVNSNWQRVAIGAIIMVAVAFDELQKRRTRKT